MAKLGLAIFILVTGVAGARLEAGFRSPESLVRNVYAFYGNGSPGLSSGLPHDTETARQFFDQTLRKDWAAAKPPYDFLVQSTSWKLGAISVAVTRKHVAVAFRNNERAISLNFLVVNGPDGWVIADVESTHDSLRSFLAQYRN
jgi:hypothetical protein